MGEEEKNNPVDVEKKISEDTIKAKTIKNGLKKAKEKIVENRAKNAEKITVSTKPDLYDVALTKTMNFGAAFIIFMLGWWMAKTIKRITRQALEKSHLDNSLRGFVSSLVYTLVMIFVVLAVLRKVGIETASVIAMLGAAGIAVGLALQGSLSNIASGLLIIILRPFKAGDYIEAADVEGVVDEIDIFTTRIITLDNKLITIPNASLTAHNITNYTALPTRRIDLVYGVGYEADIDHVRSVLMQVLESHPKVLDLPVPTVSVLEMADSSVNFAVRPWVKPEDYWQTFFDLNEAAKKALDREGINIPFPQRDVHVYQHNNEQVTLSSTQYTGQPKL